MTEPEKRFLWPREHGAWAQMAMPLATALALAFPPAGSAWLLALAAVLLFLAHEPLLVLLGVRGARARADDGPLARRLLAGLGGPAALAGAAGLVLAPAAARWALAPAVALVAATLGLASRKLEMTTGGEIVAGAAMASSLPPVALAGGVAPRAAWGAAAAWTLSFAIAAVAVDAVLARGRPGPDLGARGALGAVTVAALPFAALPLGMPLAVPLSLLPTAAFAVGVCLSRTGPAELRKLGWALVASTSATLLVLVLGLR